MLEIQVFGTGKLRYEGEELTGFPSQVPYELFCYLLLNRHISQPRDRLAAVFWEDYPTLSARKCLRNVLWRLRQHLLELGIPEELYLKINEESISFSPTLDYWLDVEIFEKAVISCQTLSSEELAPENVLLLEEADRLYQGDLLGSIYSDWCLYDRERLRLLHLDALFKLMGYYVVHGAYPQGIAVGEKLLSLDSTHEKIHREMMRLYWLNGDRNAALAQYKLCCQILHQELGLKPMLETQQMYEQMLHNQFQQEPNVENHHDTSAQGHKRGLPLLSQLMDELHHLQAMIEQTHLESRHLEKMIHEAQGEFEE